MVVDALFVFRRWRGLARRGLCASAHPAAACRSRGYNEVTEGFKGLRSSGICAGLLAQEEEKTVCAGRGQSPSAQPVLQVSPRQRTLRAGVWRALTFRRT